MSKASKFLFETSFDPIHAASDAPPAPTFSEDELAAARAEGYAAGHTEGRTEVTRSIEQQAAKALTVLGQQLTAMNGRFEDIRASAIESGVAVVAAAARKIVPELARRNSLGEIEHVVRESLHALYDEPRVVIRAHDDVVAILQERIEGLAAACGFSGKVVLFGDEQFADTDCRVEWADGGAERNLDELWRRIEAAIDRAMERRSALPPDTAPSSATLGN